MHQEETYTHYEPDTEERTEQAEHIEQAERIELTEQAEHAESVDGEASSGVATMESGPIAGGRRAGRVCSTDNQCAEGLRCCYPCGIRGCQNRCMRVGPNGRCPAFP